MLGLNNNRKAFYNKISNASFWKPLSASLIIIAILATGCTPKPTPVNKPADVENSLENMSDEAKKLYYYLALSDALSSNDSAYLAKIISGLGQVDPSLELFQESSNILLRQKSPVLAAKIASQGLESYPDDEYLNLILARSLEDSGHIDKAIVVLDTFIKKYGSTQDSLTEIIRMLLNSRRMPEAEKHLKPLAPDSSNKALFLHIHVLNQKEEYAASRAIAQQYIRKHPNSIDGYLALGDVAEYQKDFPTAIRAYQKASNLDPTSPELVKRLMALYILGNRPKEAMKIALSETMPPKSAIQTAYMFADLGQPELAKKLIEEKISDLGPDEQQLYFATILLRSNAPLEQILETLDKVDHTSALYLDSREFKIQVLLKYEKYDQAMTEGEQLLESMPDNADVWALQATILRKNNRNDEARELLKNARKKFPDDVEFIFIMAMLEEETGNSSKGISLMEEILKINPRHAPSLNNIGYTLAVQGRDLERALSLLRIAVEEDPTNVYYCDSLAWVLFKLGRYEEAWKNIQLCLEYGFNEAVVWEHYGEIAMALHFWEDAELGYTEALRGKPDNSAELLKKLQNVQQQIKNNPR